LVVLLVEKLGVDMLYSALFVLFFWGLQCFAHIFFKYGSAHPDKWLLGYVVGNIAGGISIWVLMLLYKNLNVNLALGLGAGGGFLCCQLVLAYAYRSPLGILQTAGILAITAGMALLALGASPELAG
jgi:multidrug transporter EmrE-like cation transporter